MNIDLLVVPLARMMVDTTCCWSASGKPLWAVSPTEPVALPARTEWTGQTFENPALSYADQMRDYVEKCTAKRPANWQRKHQRRQKQAERAAWHARNDELRQADQDLATRVETRAP